MENKILTKINQEKEKIKEFKVRKIGFFGSYSRGDFADKSDLDFSVEFYDKTFDNYMGLKFFLEDLFSKKVDLATYESLKPRIRPYILRQVQYASGL